MIFLRTMSLRNNSIGISFEWITIDWKEYYGQSNCIWINSKISKTSHILIFLIFSMLCLPLDVFFTIITGYFSGDWFCYFQFSSITVPFMIFTLETQWRFLNSMQKNKISINLCFERISTLNNNLWFPWKKKQREIS